MKNKEIDVNKLKLAKVKYFDDKRKGIEISDIDAYVLLMNINGRYINIFDIADSDVAVFSRSKYSNTLSDGLNYGTKMLYESGKMESGPCYVLENTNMRKLLGKDKITIFELESFVIFSSLYFIDRCDIIRDKVIPKEWKATIREIIIKDTEKRNQLISYFHQHSEAKKFIK